MLAGMSIRRQTSVSDETWATLKAVEFVTGEPQGKVVAKALARLLDQEPALRAQVEKAKAARAA